MYRRPHKESLQMQMRRADEETVSEYSANSNSAEDESSQDDDDNTSKESTSREESEEGSNRDYNSYLFDDSDTSSMEA